MSYILDALRKAESERQSNKAPDLHSLQSHSLDHSSASQSNWRLYALVALVALSASGAMYLFLEIRLADADIPNRPVLDQSTAVDQNSVSTSQGSSSLSVPTSNAEIELSPGKTINSSSAIKKQLIALQQASPIARTLITDLEFSFHVFSKDSAKRAIIINGLRMREGEPISDDLVLHAVTESGIVIEHEDVLIKMPVIEQW